MAKSQSPTRLTWRALADDLAHGHRVRSEQHNVCLYVNPQETADIFAALRYAAVSDKPATNDPRRISTDALRTEAGISTVAVGMGIAFRDDVLYPVLDHTPPDMRQSLVERFLSAISGVLCAELGPDNTKAALDAAKLAIDEVQKERRNAN